MSEHRNLERWNAGWLSWGSSWRTFLRWFAAGSGPSAFTPGVAARSRAGHGPWWGGYGHGAHEPDSPSRSAWHCSAGRASTCSKSGWAEFMTDRAPGADGPGSFRRGTRQLHPVWDRYAA